LKEIPTSPSEPLRSAVAKVKWRVLPLFVVMFIVNYIDRVNISFIKEQLESEVGVGDFAYGWGVFFFFCSYALLEVPANLALERLGAKRWLTIIAVAWGVIATGFAFVRNEYEFYALRFALGAAEAGFFPGVVYYFTRWIPAADRGKAMAIFLSGSAIATIISGPLSAYLLQLSVPGLQPWQWMIILEGGFSVLMAGVLWKLLDSDIKEATWLTQGERDSLALKIEQERAKTPQSDRVDKTALLTSPAMIAFCGVYFFFASRAYEIKEEKSIV
jgi:MFS family permease